MSQVHGERAHARLSPSGAKRFMACPGSVKATDHIMDTSSVFAKEGTAAHQLAETCLQTAFEPSSYKGYIVDLQPNEKFPAVRPGVVSNDDQFMVDDDMISAVETYVDFIRDVVRGDDVETALEARLDMQHVAEGMFGTGDYIAYNEAEKHLRVIDYKHGRGVLVEVKENPQLMLYGIGALKRYHNRPVEMVTLTIVQPRAAHPKGVIRSWETTPERLNEFAEEVSRAAELVNLPDAPLNPGDHCTFCPAAPTCPALREQAVAYADKDFEVMTESGVSPDQIAGWLDEVSTVETWCKKVREFAAAEAKKGVMPTGYKHVQKRATRKWRDEKEAIAALRLVGELEDDELMSEPALLSVAKIEKVVGKKRMGPFRRFISQSSTGLVLVPKSDPRPAAQASAQDEFEEHDTAE